MKYLYTILFLLLLRCDGCILGPDPMAAEPPDFIGADSNGMVVELREKYGPVVYDTGTVLVLYKGFFVLTTKDRGVVWYPSANYSCKIIQKGVFNK